MRETEVCKLCYEPIFNFICFDCLERDTERFLNLVSPELLNEFQTLQFSISTHFSFPYSQEKCIKCNNQISTPICPWCFINEVYFWLLEKDYLLAKFFSRMFNFDFLGTGYPGIIPNMVRKFEPVIISERTERTDIGICDNCGQSVSELFEIEGNWVCESCREF